MTQLFETPTVDELRRRGSAKWTAFPDALGAFVAEMDFGMAPPIQEVLHESVRLGRTGYTPTAWTDDLAAATASWCADRYDWAVPVERIRTIPDVMSGLELVLRQFSDPTKPIIVPTPAYMPFLTARDRWGRDVIEVPSPVVDGRYELDLEGIAQAFEAGADVLVLCNPWNPVGRVLSEKELVAVSEVVAEHGGRVFSDEIHAPIVFGDARHVPYASVNALAANHTITALSASKAFNLPALKCAQLILSNDADTERYDAVGGSMIHGASGFGVQANTVAYTAGGAWLAAVLTYLDESRLRFGELLAARLPQVGYRAQEGSYIAWLDVRALDLGEKPADALRQRAGVALTDGRACGEVGVGFVRLIQATPWPVLEEIVDRLARAVG